MARFVVRVPPCLDWLQTPSRTAQAFSAAFDCSHSLRTHKMWRFELAVAFLSFVCIAPRLNAATKQQFTITKNPQAIAIAQKALAAMGGAQALLAYQDSQATGTYTVYGGLTPTTYPITLKCKGTQETRVELQKPSGTTVRVVNQGQGAITRPDGTVIHLLMNNTLAERVNHIPLLSILAEYQNGTISIQYQGTSQVSGQAADVVAVSLVPTTDAIQGPLFASMTQTIFYVDQTTGLIDKIQFTNYAENDPNSPQKVEVYLGSWQSVNGISVPFHQTTYTDGNLESDLVLSSVSFKVRLQCK